MSSIIIIITYFLSSTPVWADMSQCQMIKDNNKKNLCMAEYSGSAAFCDKIVGYETRMQCQSMVVKKQRQHR
jgi:hypothetical protein